MIKKKVKKRKKVEVEVTLDDKVWDYLDKVSDISGVTRDDVIGVLLTVKLLEMQEK